MLDRGDAGRIGADPRYEDEGGRRVDSIDAGQVSLTFGSAMFSPTHYPEIFYRPQSTEFLIHTAGLTLSLTSCCA